MKRCWQHGAGKRVRGDSLPAQHGLMRHFLLVLIPLALALGLMAGAQPLARPTREYEVKAAFLFRFLQFVEWPSTAATNAALRFTIGILGEDPFGAVLEETIAGETLNGRSLTIKRAQQVAEMKNCAVVFVCSSQKNKVRAIVQELGDSNILTVSDIDQFCTQGGMIGLLTEGGRICFEINQEAAERQGLKISSRLLRLGRVRAKN